MPKLDNIEYQRRIFIIQGWIVEGIQTALIIRQIISSGWTKAATEKDRHRSAVRMLRYAKEQWLSVPDEDLEQRRRLKVTELQQYKRSLKDVYKGTPAGIKTLLAIDKEIIALEGLRKAIKVEVAGKDGNPIETNNTHVILSAKEIREISDALEKEV